MTADSLPVYGNPELVRRLRPDLVPELAERWRPTAGPFGAIYPVDWAAWARDARRALSALPPQQTVGFGTNQ